MSLINKLTFTCTDRLNETKNLEKDLNNNENNDKKVSNQNLIDKLNEFQSEVNQLMTDFVNKEKKAVEAKILIFLILFPQHCIVEAIYSTCINTKDNFHFFILY